MRYSTLILAGILIVVFTMQQIFPEITETLLLNSSKTQTEPWRIFTSIFAHSGMLHILYNLFGLLLFGLILEEKIGTKKFLLVFFLCGIAGSIAANFFYDKSLGASGAILGIIGCLAVIEPFMIVYAYYLPMPLFIAALVWAGGDVLGFIIPSNIANAAHLAGLSVGITIGAMIRGKKPLFKPQKKRPNLVSEKDVEEWEKEYMKI